jgi:hypothetical protein
MSILWSLNTYEMQFIISFHGCPMIQNGSNRKARQSERMYDIVSCRPISRQRPKYAHATIKKVLQHFFYVVGAMPIARQRVTKHIPADANTWNNRRSITKQRRGKQALPTIQAVFSVGSVQSGYKRVEFRCWQLWRNENENWRVQWNTMELAWGKKTLCVCSYSETYKALARIRLSNVGASTSRNSRGLHGL